MKWPEMKRPEMKRPEMKRPEMKRPEMKRPEMEALAGLDRPPRAGATRFVPSIWFVD